MSDSQLKILVAIDHNLFANGLSRLLSDVPDVTVCKVVNCGNQLVEEYGAVKPDVAIVDLNIPNLNGIQATRKIMKDFPNARIIILSLYVNTSLIRQLKYLRIKGYLESNSDFDNLVETIKQVSSGDGVSDQNLKSAERRFKEDKITRREIEILKWLSEGYTNVEIGTRLGISYQTVDTHRKRLIDKLGVRNSVELVSKAVREGIIVWTPYLIALETAGLLII